MSSQSTTAVLEPKPSHPWKSIEQEIREAFRQRIHNFRIEAIDSGLVLEGRTKTYYGKQEVLHAVMNATSLPIAANNIVVG